MKRIVCLLVAMALVFSFSGAGAFAAPNSKENEDLTKITVKKDYTLTIYYIYFGGGTAAPTHREILKAGDHYYVPSPVISGYRVSTPIVSGTMPDRNVEYTVIYFPEKGMTRPVNPETGEEEEIPELPIDITTIVEITTIEDLETPLGLGQVNMQVGVDFE